MLSGDNFTEVVKRAPGNLRFVISNNATAPASQPDFGRIIRRRPLANMNMDWLARFVGPKEDPIATNKKKARQL